MLKPGSSQRNEASVKTCVIWQLSNRGNVLSKYGLSSFLIEMFYYLVVILSQGVSEAVARRCSLRKVVLRNFSKFTGKHLCQRLFFNKIAGLRPVTLLKKRPWHRGFPVNFEEFPRIPVLQNTSWRLLLVSWKMSKETVLKHCPKNEVFH